MADGRSQLKLTQNGYFAEKFFVHLALSDGRSHQDTTVRVSVETPQFYVSFSCLNDCAKKEKTKKKMINKKMFPDKRVMMER